MKTGFIGFGSMGSMLVFGLLRSGSLVPKDTVVSTRDLGKTTSLRQLWPGVDIEDDNCACARLCRRVFLCVKPLDLEPLLSLISPYLSPDTHLISIAACVTLSNLEKRFSGSITKVIPSFTAETGEGISLVCHNDHVTKVQREDLERLLSALGSVTVIKEENFEAAADLTSCAPGFIAAICREFVAAGIRHSSLDPVEAEKLVRRTLYGTSLLFEQRETGFDETIRRVATVGGITEEGVRVLGSDLPKVFDALFEKTLSKHEQVKGLVNKQFKGGT